uniref:ShKT domain-containing protein n=2 Tax=Caenorhabditis tropicalis TaxID=1561998 RepID=A0A1I7UAZ1_9PELO
MVKRGKPERMLRQILSFANVTVAMSVPDVEKLIKRNEGTSSKSRTFSKWLHDDPILDSEPDLDLTRVGTLKKAKYPFGDYASYADMVKYMRTIEFYYPRIAKIVRIGATHEGKPIEGLKIGARSSHKKRAVWVDGNIHAREWASSHTALYFINQLVSEYGKDPTITNYVDTLDFYIVPCLNPDGYEYTRSSPIPSVRLWRKNRSPEVCRPSLWGGEKCCQGVDLNRNFRFHWAERGSSYEPCSNIYHGEEVFSEPETKAIRNFLGNSEMKDRVDAFVTLHSYAQLWIYPYSHEEQNYPEDIGELRKTARKAINRLSRVYGTNYRMGTGADTLSPAAGGSDDWAKSALNVKYVYLIELRPQMELSNGFILHKKELIPTAVETFEGFREVVDAVLVLNNSTSSGASSGASTTRKTISDLQMRKQQYRMRLLASQATSKPTTVTTTQKVSTTTIEAKPTRHFDRFTADPSSSTRARPTPPMAPPMLLSTEFTTTTEDDVMTSSVPEKATTRFGFYTATKPSAFLDPECRDMRYSCGFWLKNNKMVCEEQQSFMRAQCAYTCKFCTSFIKRH